MSSPNNLVFTHSSRRVMAIIVVASCSGLMYDRVGRCRRALVAIYQQVPWHCGVDGQIGNSKMNVVTTTVLTIYRSSRCLRRLWLLCRQPDTWFVVNCRLLAWCTPATTENVKITSSADDRLCFLWLLYLRNRMLPVGSFVLHICLDGSGNHANQPLGIKYFVWNKTKHSHRSFLQCFTLGMQLLIRCSV